MKKISILSSIACLTLLSCAAGENGQDGTNGKDGSSCTVIQNEDGSCSDGTSATVGNDDAGSDGKDGEGFINFCLPGFYGPECKPCTCEHGKCDDTSSGDGHCSCEFNYTGINCNLCAENYSGANCVFDNYGSFTASDGNTYKTFTINNQTWMAENLRNADIEHYSVDNNSANDAQYGYLYTWENAMKACPSGWRLPTRSEFEKLVSTTGTSYNNLSSIRDSSWKNGSNTSGFSALPAGIFVNYTNSYYAFGSGAAFWSSTPDGVDVANDLDVFEGFELFTFREFNDALSVRCIKNTCDLGFTGPDCKKITCANGSLNTDTGTCAFCNQGWTGENCDQCADRFTGSNCGQCTDRFTGSNCDQCADGYYGDECEKNYGSFTASDGNTYKTVTINNKTWMAENLRNADIKHYSVDGNSDNDEYDSKYGYLYTWENAMKACPSGWHLPTKEEFNKLLSNTGAVLSSNIRDTSWANGSNTSGFRALPAGNRYGNGSFNDFSAYAYFWSSSPSDSYGGAYSLYVNPSYAIVDSYAINYAFSVRCIQD